MKILHLSDLHFGFRPVTSAEHKTPVKSSAFAFIDQVSGKPRPADLVRILTRDATCHSPDFLIGSGDIGWSGVKEDYSFALRFFRELRLAWPKTKFIITAGNHDVNVNARKNNYERQDAFIKMLQDFYKDDFARVFPFLRAKHSAKRRERMIAIEHVKDEILIAAVNSAASIQEKKDPILLYPSVFHLLDERIAKLNVSKRALRVFVLHHHLFPFAEPVWSEKVDVRQVRERPDTSIVANSARVQAWLADNNFSILLHGHKHVFHGREDLLWRHDSADDKRRLLVVGAGSASVTMEEMGKIVPHSFNLIDVGRRGSNSWDIRVATANIADKNIAYGVRSWTEHKVLMGSAAEPGPCLVQAENMKLCHQAIQKEMVNKTRISNFLSIVETSTYLHSESIRIGDRPASQADVERSFIALHPEYDEQDGWNNAEKIENMLSRLKTSYRIQHGPRMFSRIGNGLPPIRATLELLPRERTRAFVGLYNPEKDVSSDWEPLPGLVGLQFIPNEGPRQLDIVLIFRNLELSFWWAVNMLEASRLLAWACKRKQYRPGRVTFYSALAEWRPDPRPMFVSELDKMREEELFVLIVNADSGNGSTLRLLAGKIEEKARNTSELNIQSHGLELLSMFTAGIIEARKHKRRSKNNSLINESFKTSLDVAIRHLKDAINHPDKRSDSVEFAQNILHKIGRDLSGRKSSATL